VLTAAAVPAVYFHLLANKRVPGITNPDPFRERNVSIV
jgi:hypothetical protein